MTGIITLNAALFFVAFYLLKKDLSAKNSRRLVNELKKDLITRSKEPVLFKQATRKNSIEAFISELWDLSKVNRYLVAAGIAVDPARFILLTVAAGTLIFILTLVSTLNIIIAMLLAITGSCTPIFYFYIKKQKRDKQLIEQMPDVLDMIVRSLKVGHSVDGALKDAGGSFPAPLGTEIALIYEEIAMGLPFKTALNNFENRFPDVSEVQIFCAAFILQRETGGNLSAILSNLSTTIRERFQLERQVKAYTSEGRISAVVIGLLPPVFAVITWFLNPDYIKVLLTHPLGQKFLIAALFFEVSGFVIMRMMTKIDI